MHRRFAAILLACAFGAGVSPAQEKPKSTHNDQMYPPAAAARPFIDFDGKGFIIGGKRTFLSSGTIHYPRVPHELWNDRMLRMQQASFNSIESYAFWNLNEPREGEFDFTGDKDIGAFYEAAKQHGLYGIARIGPYVCAEWDFGGWPVWLKTKPDMNVRTADPAYLALNDHWYSKILGVLAPHQIDRGGNIVMVQLENEHPLGWGVVEDQPYFVHLKEAAQKSGLEVPFFMSGLHHGGPPRSENVDPSKRTNPWFTTEFWAGWFDAYRTLADKRARNIDLEQWAIVAHGGGGYNFYVVHGGTDFDTWNDDSVGASYDYGTAIGQAGDLRPMYYRMKRVNQLAQSFPGIFADSTDALPAYQDFATGQGVKVLGARESGEGAFVFLQNNNAAPATATLKSGESLKLSRYGTYPLPVNVAVAEGVRIADSSLPVLARARHGAATTMVIYGEPGETGRLTLATASAIQPGTISRGISVEAGKPGTISLKIMIPASGIEECNLDMGAESLRILAITKDLSLYTWLLGGTGRQYLVFGPAFVSDLRVNGGQPSLVIERPYGQPAPGQVAIYGGRGEEWHLGVKADPSLENQPAPMLGAWEQSVPAETSPAFDDSHWPASEQPAEMGAHGNNGAFGWYRAAVEAPSSGSGTLRFKAADDAQLIVNGHAVPTDKTGAAVELTAGKNTLTFLVAHHGRNKCFGYQGSLVHRDDKGLLGAPTLEIAGEKREVTGWRLGTGPGADPSQTGNWTPVTNAAPAAAALPSYYRAHFTAKPPGKTGTYPILRATFAGLARGTMWINGHNLGQYPEKIRIDSLYLPECWLSPGGDNVLTIFDEKGAVPDKVRIVVEQPASRELIAVSSAVPPATPLNVPPENPPIDLDLLNKGNLAYKRPATATGSQNNSPAQAATDGDTNTQWAAPYHTKDAALTVDLGQPSAVTVCEILWDGAAKNYHYALEGSIDAAQWTKLGDNTTAAPSSPDSPSELSRLILPGERIRYLRVTLPDTGKGAGIAELRAFAGTK